MKSRIHVAVGAALVVAAVVGTAGIGYASSHKDRTVIEADSMIGVRAPYTGATNAIRGIPGGGAPWVIDRAKVELKASGKVEVEVAAWSLLRTARRRSPARTRREVQGHGELPIDQRRWSWPLPPTFPPIRSPLMRPATPRSRRWSTCRARASRPSCSWPTETRPERGSRQPAPDRFSPGGQPT